MTSTRFPEQFAAGAGVLPGGEKVLGVRKAALDAFVAKGLPTSRDEDWKYTSLSQLASATYELADLPQGLNAVLVSAHVMPQGAPRAVFVNGHFAPSLSSATFPQGVKVRPLSAELDRGGSEVLEARADLPARSLSALNAAFTQDGAVVQVEAGAHAAQPLHLLFVSTPGTKPVMAHPRSRISLGKDARLTLLVSHLGLEGERFFHNAVTEVRLEEGAELRWLSFQDAAPNAIHLDHVAVTQAKGSRFHSHVVAVGGAIARTEVEVRFAGEGAEATLEGLFVGQGKQHQDQRTYVDHAVPACTSTQRYKGVLNGDAHGVFNGKLLVRVDAQKTNAAQNNQNLILSEGAQIDTRPQLEIFTDDVKCAHGVTVGQLDETALFYLRSRGIPAGEAQALLTFAFASEVLGAISVPAWRSLVQRRVAARLPSLAAAFEQSEGGER